MYDYDIWLIRLKFEKWLCVGILSSLFKKLLNKSFIIILFISKFKELKKKMKLNLDFD